METNLIDIIRNLCNSAETASGPDTKLELKVSQVKSLLGTITEQEREILGMERSYESIKTKIQGLIDTLECYDFNEFSPDDDFDGEIFEIFVGTTSDHGRIFGMWDASSGSFHEPPEESGQVFYREDVLFWRYSLPEPHEALDLGDAL